MWVSSAMIALAACSGEDLPPPPTGDDSGPTVPTDTASIDTGSTTQGPWTIGAPLPCTDPLPAPSWTEDPDYVAKTENPYSHDDLAWQTWWEHPDGPRLIATGPSGHVGSFVPGAEDYTTVVDLGQPGGGSRVADLDEDGLEDLVVFGVPVLVFWGDGEETVIYPGPDEEWAFVDLVPVDLDLDGDLDLVGLRKEPLEVQQGPLLFLNPGDRDTAWPEFLALTDGGTDWGSPFDLGVFDFDRDGLLDLFVCVDGPNDETNRVLCNEGDLQFSDCDDRGTELAHFCMGVSFGDLDHDGDADFYMGAGYDHVHKLLIESGDGYYAAEDVLIDAVIAENQMTWGTAIIDMDNDGLPDLVGANGEFIDRPNFFPLWLLQQQGDGTFVDQGEALGLPQETGGRSVVAVDVNGDGYPELFVSDKGKPGHYYLSDGCTENNWVQLRAPLGTWATVEGGGQTFYGHITSDPGYATTIPSQLHLGLGVVDTLDRVVLQVPGTGEVALDGPVPARSVISWSL